ncbi:NADH-quinone oxidoreductase subunit 5 family protein [Pelobacter propionicus]|uniref:NADH dehydrogenase (Quinone) n=1 Tax=Pelobacter propionicus (strain DSM 2379 / NBRC 103807 / OttBd1) TaxID=338966 RepID=A1AUV4_PELPD|nr:NADH-quinone oxidoreductase subunit L [Pelobacter propionicus]ABL01125.1 NADH dehydrogenase (quinone) [Pelobacter propionicus DSM 2379]
MKTNIIVWMAVFVPIAGAFLLPLMGQLSKGLRNLGALALVTSSLICSSSLVPLVLAGGTESISIPFLGGNNLFLADSLAVFMAIVSMLVGAVIVLYSMGYISHYDNQNEYYFMVVLFLGSMMGIVYSANLILIYLFWEITAIACWRLIGFFREPLCVVRADKAFLMTGFGAFVMLIGFIMIHGQYGSFDLQVIKSASAANPVANLAVLLILFGILSKSATFPLHTWLPDAGVAPTPVTALLHAAVLVKIGVYVYARLFVASFTVDPAWNSVVPMIAGISALVSGGAALIETDMKRIIAYSTVSQLGFILLGLSIGNPLGFAGGLLYILMHSIAKGGIFLCAGVVEQKLHVKDITKLGGLIKTMPVTAVSFLLCSFSVMGIPPFGGFFSKYMVIAGAIRSGDYLLTTIFILGAFLTVIYLFRIFAMIFLGEPKTTPVAEGAPVMLVSVALLALLSLAGGLLISYPSLYVQTAVQQIMGVTP